MRLLGILVQLRGLGQHQLYLSGDFNQDPSFLICPSLRDQLLGYDLCPQAFVLL